MQVCTCCKPDELRFSEQLLNGNMAPRIIQSFVVGLNTGSYGIGAICVHSLHGAAHKLLDHLYAHMPHAFAPKTEKSQPAKERNAELRRRYAQGESLSALGRAFNISPQRVWQFVKVT
jgi:hypothetical protein